MLSYWGDCLELFGRLFLCSCWNPLFVDKNNMFTEALKLTNETITLISHPVSLVFSWGGLIKIRPLGPFCYFDLRLYGLMLLAFTSLAVSLLFERCCKQSQVFVWIAGLCLTRMDGCASWKLCLTHKCVRFWQETEIIPLIKYKSFRKVFSLVSPRLTAARVGDVPALAHGTWMSVEDCGPPGSLSQAAACSLSSLPRPAPWHSPPALPLLRWGGLKSATLPAACDVVALLSVTRPAWSVGNLPTITLHNRFYYHLFAHSHSAVFSNNRSQGRMTPVISQCGSHKALLLSRRPHVTVRSKLALLCFDQNIDYFKTYSHSELLFLIKGHACKDIWFTGSFFFLCRQQHHYCLLSFWLPARWLLSSCKNGDEGTHGFSLDPVNNTYPFIGGFCHVCLMTWLCREI